MTSAATIQRAAGRRAHALRAAYRLMLRRFGHQHWWPGETPFEVCVGAILTQNTSWSNVERAIANLKQAGVMSATAMHGLPEAELARLIRPAGYFNLKAKRLRAFLRILIEGFGGSLPAMFAGSTSQARERLLAIYGIGPETADSMLLYAGQHLSFVVDAYTKRIFSRHGWWTPQSQRDKAGINTKGRRDAKGNTAQEYEALQRLCEAALGEKPAHERLDYWQDYHAQLVMVGKHYCLSRTAKCEACPLRPLLPGAGAGNPQNANDQVPRKS
jgi:endonuclease-3 related protein